MRKCLSLSEKRKRLAEKKKKKASRQHAVLSTSAPSPQRLAEPMSCFQSGRFIEAERLARSLVEDFPSHQFGWKALGVVLKETGRLNEALMATGRAVE